MGSSIASTPDPPYTAVVFTSTRTAGDHGYARMSDRMDDLARRQPGYLGHESARGEDLSITVSYWVDHPAAGAWKQVAEHLVAQECGRATWYSDYTVRVATVDRDYTLADGAARSVIDETPPNPRGRV